MSINWKKGFFRLTLVLSIVVFLSSIAIGISERDISAVGGGAVVFAGIWLVYAAVYYVINGFKSKD